MNKHYYLPIFGLVALLVAAYYFRNSSSEINDPFVSAQSKVSKTSPLVPEESAADVDLAEGMPEPSLDKGITQDSSPEWKELLEENLRAQGGDEIEEIKIDKVDSFVWSHEGVSLNVDSVVITIRGRQNQRTKFRAIVDPKNGKILNSWDRPIVEYADPSKRRGIKVDPRYHQE